MKTTMKFEVSNYVENNTNNMINVLCEKRVEARKALNKAMENGDVDEIEEMASLITKLSATITMLNSVKNLY